MRALGPWLALSLLCASSQALGGPLTPTYVRISLDDEQAAPLGSSGPRRIRETLDDSASASQASFPLDGDGRLIRLSLDEGLASYGHLSPPRQQARRLRTTLD